MNKKSIFYGILGGALGGGAIAAIKKAIDNSRGTHEEPDDERDDTEYMDADDEQEDADSD